MLRIRIAKVLFTSCLFSVFASAANIGGYTQTTLQTNLTDPALVNPWGISESPGSPFWVSNNGTGTSTLYNTAGVKQGLVVSMPAGSEPVTGQVFNGTAANFNGDTFLFASENGTIAGWRGALGTTAEQLFSVAGANYKGLAISGDKSMIFGANFATGAIDVFSSAGKTGSFSDATIPAGFAPFNIQNINGVLYVTFAKQGVGGDDMRGPGNGFVDIFDPVTHSFSRLISQGDLNSPWGLAIAPSTFGDLAGDLLVGNFGNGMINAYNVLTGTSVGTLADVNSNAIVDRGLWGLQFGNGGNGGLTTSLYLTAGPNGETGGLFARIDPVPEPGTMFLCSGAVAALLFLRRRGLNRL